MKTGRKPGEQPGEDRGDGRDNTGLFVQGNRLSKGQAPGGPPGNRYALKHGLSFLKKTLKGGRFRHLRGMRKVIENIKAEIAADLGGDLSAQQKVIADDIAKCLVFVHSIDAHLLGLPNIFESKGAQQWMDERRRLAGHVAASLKLLGLKRVAKDVNDLDAYIKARYGSKGEE